MAATVILTMFVGMLAVAVWSIAHDLMRPLALPHGFPVDAFADVEQRVTPATIGRPQRIKARSAAPSRFTPVQLAVAA